MRFVVYRDNAGQWRWRLLVANNKVIADSGEGYVNKSDCLHGIALVRSANAATPVNEV